MALTVEDGTGLAGAESYQSVAEFRAYCGKRAMDIDAYGDDEIEVALRRATQYLDIKFEYGGDASSITQALEFPRTGLTWRGATVTGVAARIKVACNEMAFRALSVDIMPDVDKSSAVKSETVGPLSTTYKDDAPEATLFRVAEALVAPLTRGQGRPGWLTVNGPTLGQTSTAPYFTLGMQDEP